MPNISNCMILEFLLKFKACGLMMNLYLVKLPQNLQIQIIGQNMFFYNEIVWSKLVYSSRW